LGEEKSAATDSAAGVNGRASYWQAGGFVEVFRQSGGEAWTVKKMDL